jgi:hypothetical protein
LLGQGLLAELSLVLKRGLMRVMRRRCRNSAGGIQNQPPLQEIDLGPGHMSRSFRGVHDEMPPLQTENCA